MNANIATMTQAEKIMLRYSYVLSRTGDAQGDFLRTADSWSNRVRVLNQQLMQFSSIVGEVFINALKPALRALNTFMNAVIKVARTIADSLGKIFGWKMEITETGVADELSGAAGAADDTASGLNDAAKAAKKLKQYTLGFDELHVINPDDGDSGSGGAGGAVGGGGLSAEDSTSGVTWVKELKDYESDLDSLAKLGEYISTSLTESMNNIPWDSIYEKAAGFGTGLATFLNNLITPDLFGALGRTIAGTLNTALHFLDGFGTEFDWTNFGVSIGTGTNEFFRTFKFSLGAETLNTWATGILDSMIVALEATDWVMIGNQIGTFLAGIDVTTIASKLGTLFWEAIKAAFGLLAGLFEEAPIETALIAAFATLKFSGIGLFIANSIGTAVSRYIGAALAAKLGVAIAANSTISTVLGTAISTKITAALPVVLGAVSKMGAAIGAMMAGPWGAVITAAMLAIFAIITNWEDVKNFFAVTLPDWFDNELPKLLNKIVQWWAGLPGNIFVEIYRFVTDTLPEWKTNVDTWVTQELPKIIDGIAGWFRELPDKIMEKLKSVYQSILDIGGYILDGIFEGMKDIGGRVSGFIKNLLSSTQEEADINSPSRLFKDEVGVYIGEGIAEGILGSESSVIGAMEGLLAKIQERFANTPAIEIPMSVKMENTGGEGAGGGLDTGGTGGGQYQSYYTDFKTVTDMILETQEDFQKAFNESWDSFSVQFKEGYLRYLTGIYDQTYTAMENIRKGFQHVSDEVIKMLNRLVDAANKLAELTGKSYSHVSGYTMTQGEKFVIPAFAGGGFPGEDGLFLANHGELVGQFSNGKTAVANNEQIIQGIAQGVYNAVVSAMKDSGGGEINANLTVELDGEAIYRNQQRIGNTRGYNFNLGNFQR